MVEDLRLRVTKSRDVREPTFYELFNNRGGSGADWNVALNITNLFDRPPPIVASYSSGGTAQNIPNGYDQYGRRYQLSLNMNF